MFSCSTFRHKYFTLLFFPSGLWSVEMNMTSCLALGSSSRWAGVLHSWGTKRKRRLGVLSRVAEPADGAWECKSRFAMVGLSVCLHHHIAFSNCWSLGMDFKKVILSCLFCPWAFLPPVKGSTWAWQTQSRALIPLGAVLGSLHCSLYTDGSQDPQSPQSVDLGSTWLPGPWDWIGVFTLSHPFNYLWFNWVEWGKGNAFNFF